MSGFLVLMLVGALMLFRVIARTSAPRGGQGSGAARITKRKPEKEELPAVVAKMRKREQMAQREQWRAAKAQQDDAERLHAVHVDSCESKLESLRVLHEAGILDNVEYAERVARTKAKHARAGRE
jgi:hypothetical protein